MAHAATNFSLLPPPPPGSTVKFSRSAPCWTLVEFRDAGRASAAGRLGIASAWCCVPTRSTDLVRASSVSPPRWHASGSEGRRPERVVDERGQVCFAISIGRHSVLSCARSFFPSPPPLSPDGLVPLLVCCACSPANRVAAAVWRWWRRGGCGARVCWWGALPRNWSVLSLFRPPDPFPCPSPLALLLAALGHTPAEREWVEPDRPGGGAVAPHAHPHWRLKSPLPTKNLS